MQSDDDATPEDAEDLPAAQFVQVMAAAPENVPDGHVRQVLEPADEENPAGQLTHTATDVAPDDAEYFPAAQFVQAAVPVAIVYVPAGHTEHSVDAAEEYLPVAQTTQEIDAVAPAVVEYRPAGQFVQLLSPLVAAKVPAPHSKHSVEPAGAYDPVLHELHDDTAVWRYSAE